MKRIKQFKIYRSRWHILFTLGFVAIPFFFLLLFGRVAHIATPTLFLDVGSSFLRIFLAYLIAAVLGWLGAVLFYRGKRAAVALPLFDVLQSFPTFAALPLAVFFWGPSNATVILFLVFTIIWPIFFSITSALKLAKHDWEEVVQIAGLRGFNYFRFFLGPVSVPSLVTGSIIGLGEGWEALVATEIIVKVRQGLGSFFTSFSTNPAITAFGIFTLLLIIFSINKLFWLPLLEWSHHTLEE